MYKIRILYFSTGADGCRSSRTVTRVLDVIGTWTQTAAVPFKSKKTTGKIAEDLDLVSDNLMHFCINSFFLKFSVADCGPNHFISASIIISWKQVLSQDTERILFIPSIQPIYSDFQSANVVFFHINGRLTNHHNEVRHIIIYRKLNRLTVSCTKAD